VQGEQLHEAGAVRDGVTAFPADTEHSGSGIRKLDDQNPERGNSSGSREQQEAACTAVDESFHREACRSRVRRGLTVGYVDTIL
jgi:hypothetical protein